VLWEDSFKSGKAKAPPSLTSFILWVLFFPFYFFHSRRCCELWSISLSLSGLCTSQIWYPNLLQLAVDKPQFLLEIEDGERKENFANF
jgi:hypothetical protein